MHNFQKTRELTKPGSWIIQVEIVVHKFVRTQVVSIPEPIPRTP